MIYVIILDVNVRNKVLLLQKNIKWKVLVLKLQRKKINGSQTACKKFLKPAVNVAAPFVGLAVSAKTKNPKVGQATTNILKILSGGKLLSLTDMPRSGLRLKVI